VYFVLFRACYCNRCENDNLCNPKVSDDTVVAYNDPETTRVGELL
jgi:hypothetical protein